MSAEAMDVPRGEVLLDGRVMRPDGSWSGVKAAGEVVRGTIGDTGPAQIVVPPGAVLGPRDLSSEVGAIIPYAGAPPKCVFREPVADVFWFETFMERLTRRLEGRESVAH